MFLLYFCEYVIYRSASNCENHVILDPEEESKRCHCPGCIKKRELLKNAEPWKGPKNLLIKLIIIGGWVMLIFLAYKVSQFDYEMANFDPYEILGISPGAGQAEIKKAYRRLSVILHPDKETGNEKEFMKLTKAYQVHTLLTLQIMCVTCFIVYCRH